MVTPFMFASPLASVAPQPWESAAALTAARSAVEETQTLLKASNEVLAPAACAEAASALAARVAIAILYGVTGDSFVVEPSERRSSGLSRTRDRFGFGRRNP